VVDIRRDMNSATFPDSWSRRPARARPAVPPVHKFHLPGILLCCLIGVAQMGHRAWAEAPCPIPDDIALHGISLPAAQREVAADQQLIVLTFGGVQPAGAEAESSGATWPARLNAALRAALPQIQVTVANRPPPGKSSSDVPAVLADLIAQTGARLVIWGPGGRDVAAGVGLDAFDKAVQGGIDAVRGANADLILLDTTFVPSPARMAMIEDYRQKLLATAAANHVPLLRRHAMMRIWSEDGTLNLGAREQAERELVVRHLFSCVAQALAPAIATAVK
jgi:acyl-CoA thioesterase-1